MRRVWLGRVVWTLGYGLSVLSLRGACGQEARLWYRRPAAVWTEALPVGNGHVGAMMFGGANAVANNGDTQDAKKNADLLDGSKTRPQDEHLQLNEQTIWQGAREDRLNPLAHEGFKDIRKLLLAAHGEDAGKIAAAEKEAAATMISTPRGMPGYATLGDLYLRSASGEAVTEYRRELELQTGISSVSYTAGGVHYRREVFASAPDDVIVMRWTADRPGSLSFDMSMDRPSDFAVRRVGAKDMALTQGPGHKEEIRFEGRVRIRNQGGSVSAAGDGLHVEKADEVEILIAAATTFRGGAYAGGDPEEQCAVRLDRASAKSYAALEAAATADERQWMDRMDLQLGTVDAALEALPTDERLRRVSSGQDDLGLQALYFQFARYLLVGSSRPGGLPANLQGLWASGVSNPWGSKYTINVNTEMNYWMAEAANLGELHQPVYDLVDMVRNPSTGTGVQVARKYYAADGFVIHHNTDIWGDANPIDVVYSGIWPMGGAWMTLHAWDHYAFSQDTEFLRMRAWPQMHDASAFFLSYLVEDSSGHLVTGPSVSPENKYKLATGETFSLTMGPTMDIEIVRELFTRTLQAGAILKTDPVFLAKVRSAMEKLPPFKVGHLGNLQEWQEDYADAAPGHRHISHLWALFPGTQISPRETPELAAAARVTLETRLRNGGGQTGWSRAWVVNYWDALHEGDQAYESMQVLFRQSTFPNMMDTHPPGVFQIDGNLGAANGMLGAIVQSRWFPEHVEVELLPALPGVWKDGMVRGTRVRGGSELTMRWKEGRVESCEWRAGAAERYRIHVPAGQVLASLLKDGKTAALPRTAADGVFEMDVARGSVYELGFQAR
jgi:alpha-L-fucosidase 2